MLFNKEEYTPTNTKHKLKIIIKKHDCGFFFIS